LAIKGRSRKFIPAKNAKSNHSRKFVPKEVIRES